MGSTTHHPFPYFALKTPILGQEVLKIHANIITAPSPEPTLNINAKMRQMDSSNKNAPLNVYVRITLATEACNL